MLRERETKHKRILTEWYNWYETLEKTNEFGRDRKQFSGCLGPR